MKIILFNGPPRSGKDTLAKTVIEKMEELGKYKKAYIYKFADRLKKTVHAFLGLDFISLEHAELIKDTEIIMGKTLREWYIYFSEVMIKPSLGKDTFGKLLVEDFRERENSYIHSPGYLFITDSGFKEEVIPVLDYFGIENLAQIKVFRNGTSFLNDSRSYWDIKRLKSVNVYNNASIKEGANKVLEIIDEISKEDENNS